MGQSGSTKIPSLDLEDLGELVNQEEETIAATDYCKDKDYICSFVFPTRIFYNFLGELCTFQLTGVLPAGASRLT